MALPRLPLSARGDRSAVWLYFRFHLSFRDVQQLLAERGIVVSREAIREWCSKFGPS
jgi:putative transposase